MYGLFDIGGTKTRVAVSRDGSSLGELSVFDTPRDYAAGVAAIGKALQSGAEGKSFTGVAGGVRGVLLPGKNGIAHDDVLVEWQGKPLAEDLSRELNASVVLENDAALAALGEAVRGAGEGYRIVAYHTVSTGVGGARVVAGKIDEHGVGFEPGHQSIDADKTMLPGAESIELEDYISGTAVERRFGKKPREIPQEDPLWHELARLLGIGLKNTVVYWSPDVVVLGGSMILGAPAIPISETAQQLEIALGGLMPVPLLRRATLGEQGALYGALALLQAQDLSQHNGTTK